eukprot:tig00021726_g23255.t1
MNQFAEGIRRRPGCDLVSPARHVQQQQHVFISYRRNGGDDLAQLIYRELRRRWYSVFLDVKQMTAGHFDDRLFIELRNSCCVVLLLTASTNERGEILSTTLDRCRGDIAGKDWLHKEIVEALKNKITIIPNEFFPWEHTLSDATLDYLCKYIQQATRQRCAVLRIAPESLVPEPAEVATAMLAAGGGGNAEPETQQAAHAQSPPAPQKDSELEHWRSEAALLRKERDEARNLVLKIRGDVGAAADPAIAAWGPAAGPARDPGPAPPEAPVDVAAPSLAAPRSPYKEEEGEIFSFAKLYK